MSESNPGPYAYPSSGYLRIAAVVFALAGLVGYFVAVGWHFPAWEAGQFAAGAGIVAVLLLFISIPLRRTEADPKQVYRNGDPVNFEGSLTRDRNLLQRLFFALDRVWIIPGEDGFLVRRRSMIQQPGWGTGLGPYGFTVLLGFLASFIGLPPALNFGRVVLETYFLLLVFFLVFDPPKKRMLRSIPWKDLRCAVETTGGIVIHFYAEEGPDSLDIDLSDQARRRLLPLLDKRTILHRRTPAPPPPPPPPLDEKSLREIDEAMEELARH